MTLAFETSSYISDSAIAVCASTLNAIRVHAGCWVGGELSKARLLPAIEVDVFQIEGMDVSRDLMSRQLLSCYGVNRHVNIDSRIRGESSRR